MKGMRKMEAEPWILGTGACLIILLTTAVWRLLTVFYWRPRALAAQLSKHGIHGPPIATTLKGNLAEILRMRGAVKDHDMKSFTHNVVERALPDHVHWSKQYGKRYVVWWGMEPKIMITEPELIREILLKKTSQFGKSEAEVFLATMILGRGLVAVTGEEWSRHRRIVAPAFYQEKLKAMTGVIASCTSSMLDQWETRMEQKQEVEIYEEMNKLTTDVIAHTAFGSSYLSGQKVYDILRDKFLEQAFKLVSLSWIPGSRYLPFPASFKLKQLHKEIATIITHIIDERRKCNSYGDDFLGLMLKECEGDNTFTNGDLIDECKTFYFAGQEPTARLISWSMMLLAGHPEWQEQARAEVREICGDAVPDGDTLSKLKLVGMVIYEALRLYPSAVLMGRTCFEDTWVKDMFVPKGVAVSIPIIAIHHDKELWGEDADEFNPERFKNGITNACKHPNAFMPFSLGPRVCVAQSFVPMEAKVVLALILQRFSFRLSPNYRHNPALVDIGFKPIHGVQLIFNKV